MKKCRYLQAMDSLGFGNTSPETSAFESFGLRLKHLVFSEHFCAPGKSLVLIDSFHKIQRTGVYKSTAVEDSKWLK